ncbi:MAG: alkaline phosphatase family protein [Burkholderiaceae bacterium]|nr:alkaline phosphatase family protein [Burkholderiaceae bacterium]
MTLNVLLITADQWRADCLSAVGHPLVKTPGADALAAEGILFERHYCQSAPCAPARASLLTGLYQMNHRVVRNGTPLDARHDNLALAMRRLGYEPVLFGYTDSAADPRECAPADPRLATYEGILPGFNQRLPMDSTAQPWLAWLRRRGAPVPEPGLDIYLPRHAAADPPSGAPSRYRAEDSEAAYLVEGLLDYIDERGSSPWFAHLSLIRPHPPWIAPEPYNAMYDPGAVAPFVRAASRQLEGDSHPYLAYALSAQRKSDFVHGAKGAVGEWNDADLRRLRATYYGLVSEVDAQIARVIGHLRRDGQYERTLIALTTDHGEQGGDHHLLGKLGYFEQSYHVPLILRVPGAAGNGRRVGAFTEAIDLMPTILDLLGAPVPRALDGVSLRPFVEGGVPRSWRDAAHWEFEFREVCGASAQTSLGISADECSLAVHRGARYKYVHFAALPPLLFDLERDPGELHDLSDDPAHATVRLQCAERLLAWRARHLDRTLTGIELTPRGPVTL